MGAGPRKSLMLNDLRQSSIQLKFFLALIEKVAYYVYMKTIDITPTWSALIVPMMEVLKNPKANPESRKGIEEEFIRLAKIVDEYNEEAKKNG